MTGRAVVGAVSDLFGAVTEHRRRVVLEVTRFRRPVASAWRNCSPSRDGTRGVGAGSIAARVRFRVRWSLPVLTALAISESRRERSRRHRRVPMRP